jgi:thioredoxin 1
MTDSASRSSDESTATHIETVDAFDQLLADEPRVLVDFYTNWCGPCNLMASIVDELAAESDAPVVKVNAEDVPAVAKRYDVQSVPTFLTFSDGEPAERFVGMQNKSDLEATLD